jgi:hypothetical protein
MSIWWVMAACFNPSKSSIAMGKLAPIAAVQKVLLVLMLDALA